MFGVNLISWWLTRQDTHHAALVLRVILSSLRHTLEGAVLGAVVEDRGPVVGEVLRELARRAGREGRQIMLDGLHGRVE